MNTCDYGCNKPGIFILKNGKHCCSIHSNKCSGKRSRCSDSAKKAYDSGQRTGFFTQEHRIKSLEKRKEQITKNFLTTNSTHTNSCLKIVLIDNLKWEKKCIICGLTEWNNKPLMMQLDHIDGNSSNNRIENLRLLCPNCHSQTDTYCGKSINKGKKIVSDEDLTKALKETKNVRQALIMVGLAPKGSNYSRAYKMLNTI